ncbi:MAG: hypothetical protein GMKNLPBB_02824 [Myxococcota bacterium]|nr:hypothetical protein [Myxococcota bacterium]
MTAKSLLLRLTGLCALLVALDACGGEEAVKKGGFISGGSTSGGGTGASGSDASLGDQGGKPVSCTDGFELCNGVCVIEGLCPDAGVTDRSGGGSDLSSPDIPPPQDSGGGGGDCRSGETPCPRGCANLKTDTENCGSCGFKCPGAPNADAVCNAGGCGLKCKGTMSMCEGRCVDTTTDPGNCGFCGAYCEQPGGGTAKCLNSKCVTECPFGHAVCNGGCVDIRSDPNNCSGCGKVCDAGASGGEAVCESGVCKIQCEATEKLCKSAEGEDICTDTSRDPKHCGDCGKKCPEGRKDVSNATCSAGKCGLTCTFSAYRCSDTCCGSGEVCCKSTSGGREFGYCLKPGNRCP